MNTSLQTKESGFQEAMVMPTTAQDIQDAARYLRKLRRQGLTWREVSERTGYSRVQSLQLVHNVFALIDATNNGARNLAGVHHG